MSAHAAPELPAQPVDNHGLGSWEEPRASPIASDNQPEPQMGLVGTLPLVRTWDPGLGPRRLGGAACRGGTGLGQCIAVTRVARLPASWLCPGEAGLTLRSPRPFSFAQRPIQRGWTAAPLSWL